MTTRAKRATSLLAAVVLGAATDSIGSLCWITGNGTFDANTDGKDYGDTFQRVSTSGTVQDYFNGSVYFAPVAGPVQAFSLINGLRSTGPTSPSPEVCGGRGGTVAISANGSPNGILWTLQTGGVGSGVLHAYDAGNLSTELWNSNQASSRDLLTPWSKFTAPIVANGKVFVVSPMGTITGFGLLG